MTTFAPEEVAPPTKETFGADEVAPPVAAQSFRPDEVNSPLVDLSKLNLAKIATEDAAAREYTAGMKDDSFLRAITDPQTGIVPEIGKGLQREGAAIPLYWRTWAHYRSTRDKINSATLRR